MSRAREFADLAGSADAGGITGRNLIINGAMQVAQRGTVTGATLNYGGADRYQFVRDGAAAVTLSQDTDVPSNQGFSTSQKIDVTTADSSLAAGDYAIVRQIIEAQNLQHLLYGTSAAKKVTLQFWVRSPKTGTHIVELYHGDANYFNSQSYTIATADTWQKVTVTFDGYQTTSINNDNGFGLQIAWWLAAGSTYSGGTLSSNTWHNTTANRAVGQVNVMDSTSNNFYLTGVQLEVGTLTDFEHRSVEDELARCQRYYFRINEGVIYQRFALGSCANSNNAQTTITLPVTMRTTPSVDTTGNAGDYAFFEAGTVHTLTSLPAINAYGSNAESVNVTCTSTGNFAAGNAGEFLSNNDASVFFALSAEL